MNQIDHQTLQRLVGRDNIPKAVEDEYSIRISMFHRAGESGPLGIVGCIDLVRSLGVMLPLDPAKPGEIDWRTVPANGTVLVKVGPFVGQHYKGYFVGLAPNGVLGVKMIEGDYPPGWVLEVRKDMTKIVDLEAEENDDYDPAAEGRRREEALRQQQIHDTNEKIRAAKAEAAKLERSAAWSKENDEARAARESQLQAEIDALKNQLAQAPKPIVLGKPAPTPPKKGKKPVKKAAKKPAPKLVTVGAPEDDEPPRDENGDVIYNEYVPADMETAPFGANLDAIKALEPQTPLAVMVGLGDETETLEAVYLGMTEDDLVQVQVDGEDEPRVVATTSITLLT